MELLPGEWSLHVLDVLPGPSCPLLLDGVLEKGLQREQHAHHVLRGEHADIQHCKRQGSIRTVSQYRENSFEVATFFWFIVPPRYPSQCPENLYSSVSVTAFQEAPQESITEVKRASPRTVAAVTVQLSSEVRASSAQKQATLDNKLTFFPWRHFHTEHFFSADCLYPSPKPRAHNSAFPPTSLCFVSLLQICELQRLSRNLDH